MFMGIGGKEMNDLELLKRADQDLLDRNIMHHHQKNPLQGSGPRGSGGPPTPKMANSYFEKSKSSHGSRDAGNVMTMSQIIDQEEIERWHFLALHNEIILHE